MIHGDLKPQNILLISDQYSTWYRQDRSEYRTLLYTGLKLIDFGLATFDDECHQPVVGSRPYRAPEIILKQGWSFPSDMWSIGCIVFELITGRVLFRPTNDAEHLCMIHQVIADHAGRPPTASFEPITLAAGPVAHQCSLTIDNPIAQINPIDPLLVDLLRRIFVLDPWRRMTPQEALAHPWFGYL